MDRNASLTERERDSSGTNPQFERSSACGKYCKEINSWLNDTRIERNWFTRIICLGNTFTEVVVRHASEMPSTLIFLCYETAPVGQRGPSDAGRGVFQFAGTATM